MIDTDASGIPGRLRSDRVYVNNRGHAPRVNFGCMDRFRMLQRYRGADKAHLDAPRRREWDEKGVLQARFNAG